MLSPWSVSSDNAVLLSLEGRIFILYLYFAIFIVSTLDLLVGRYEDVAKPRRGRNVAVGGSLEVNDRDACWLSLPRIN